MGGGGRGLSDTVNTSVSWECVCGGGGLSDTVNISVSWEEGV